MYTTGKWSAVAIKAILLNEAYIGNVVALKRTAISFKNKKKRYNDKEDWIRFENAHEALIDMETWNVVQKLAEDRKTFRNNLNGNPSLFGGLLKCPDCGFNLKIINSYKYTGEGENRKKEVSRSSYQCTTYASCGVNVCTSHQINEDALIKIVKNDLAKFVRLLDVDEEKLRKNYKIQK